MSLPDFPSDGAEERPLPVAGDARGLDVGVEVRLGVVVGGQLVELAALLVEPEPPPLAVGVVVLDLHAEHGRDAGEAEDHDADEGPVAEPDRRRVRSPSSGRVDRMLSRSVRASSAERTGVLPFLTTCLGALTEAAGFDRHDLAGDQPVEEHPDGGQVLLDRRGGEPGLELLDVGGDGDGLDGRGA